MVPVETRAVTSYKAILVTPQQTLAILQNLLNRLHRILVLTCAATALRSLQSILRHSRIQTTLDIYTQGDGDETRAAQGAFLKELGMALELVQ